MIRDHLGRASVCPSPLTSVGTAPPPPPGVEGDLDVAALHPDRPWELGRRHRALDGREPRRPAERRQLGAGPAGGPGGQLREAARGLGEAGRGVAVEDRQPPPAIRDRHGDVGIEAPRPQDGRVNGRQPVGRRQHDDLPPRVEAVEQDEELGDQLRVMGLMQPVAPAGERVQFIDENDRRLVRAGSCEDLSEVGLTPSSSMRRTAGWCARARAKTCRSCASLPPPTGRGSPVH